MLTAIPKSAGFTVIEMMIVIAIFAITLTFGVSSYRTWVQNTQIRNAAESIESGIQRARAEAVKCNSTVAFTLLENASLVLDSSWTVKNVLDCGDVTNGGTPAGTALESRTSSEGSKNVTMGVKPIVPPSDPLVRTISFNNLGTVAANSDGSATLAEVDLTSTVATPDLRSLRVAIGLGGNARVCDPNLPSSSTDPRRCY